MRHLVLLTLITCCCAAEPAATNRPLADIVTSKGTIRVVLFADEAPLTVANFLGLAAGTREFTDPATNTTVKRPFYDGLTFHRVIKGFMIQGGDPLGSGVGGPGFSFADEINAVVGAHLEMDAPAVDFRALGIDRHRLARHRSGRVRYVDMHAEAALARVEMRRQHLEARPLHQPDHETGGEHGRHLAELGRLRIKMRHGLLSRDAKGDLGAGARFECVLHGASPTSALARFPVAMWWTQTL